MFFFFFVKFPCLCVFSSLNWPSRQECLGDAGQATELAAIAGGGGVCGWVAESGGRDRVGWKGSGPILGAT